MSLQQWLDNGWLHRHKTSPEEIENLLKIVDRDWRDANGDISADWRFGISYNAALKLCTILLYAEGYQPDRRLKHYRTIQAIVLVRGKGRQGDADYLNTCRIKRHVAEYEHAGAITDRDADELVEFVRKFKHEVVTWLHERHSELCEGAEEPSVAAYPAYAGVSP